MNNSTRSIAEAYYTAMAAKDIVAIEKYLHSHVVLIAPLAKETGKEAVLSTINKAISVFKTLTIRAIFGSDDQAMVVYDVDFPAIRAIFGSDDQAMVVYDVDFPEPIGNISSAVLMTFQDNLISKIELFYDARKIANTWNN